MHDQEGDAEPAHHARRPMNAFLIFCKRHRSVVREKYPNLENRSITKILGEWWANLDKEEKACYTGLAKQYKDAFFSANPDFKWYKLPAPPLRTLSSRPREPPEPAAPDEPDDTERTNNNSTKLDLNKKPDHLQHLHDPKQLSMFTPGKLADEAHMGGLSSLLDINTEQGRYYTPLQYNTISENYYRSQEMEQGPSSNETIRELQNALSETSKIFEKDFDKKQEALARRIQQTDLFTNQDMIDQIVEKRYSKDDDCGLQKNSSDDEKSAKSGRSCKGKRYQEFMAVGGLIVNKRHKRDYSDKSPEEMYAASCSWEPGTAVADEAVVTYIETQDMPQDHATIEIETKSEPSDFMEGENNGYKSFKAADFDLDAKIKALPSLSLEKFQERKRENKRKKKTLNLRQKAVECPHIVNSVPMPATEERRAEPELSREAAIGSQKRKPRKISITRLEINSLVSNTNVTGAYKISPEIKLAMEAPYAVLQKLEMSSQPAHESGLLALATLAEVAANTSKIEGTTLATAVPTPSDEHASKV